MKIIKPSYEIIEQKGYKLEDAYKMIELCGRTCYKSADKITEDSSKPFVDRMIASKHYAMLEHATIYLKMPAQGILNQIQNHNNEDYRNNKYSKVNTILLDFDDTYEIKEGNGIFPGFIWDMVTTNLRVIVENGWEDDLKYICEPTKYHTKRYTVKFICNRQVSHEFVRHRVFSFAMESTRYCNYTKDKFGKELTFIKPLWVRDAEDQRLLNSELESIEATYFRLINKGWKAQEAATVLPNALKTELIMTGFIDDWRHFFDLRALGTTGTPHPQASELAEPLLNEFYKRGYLNEWKQENTTKTK